MIDWSAVYRNGLVVTCRNIEESYAFWEDVQDKFREYGVEDNSDWMGKTWHIRYRHKSYADRCVSYYLIVDNGEFSISWCDREYYRDYEPYNLGEFVDYSSGNSSQSDLGELEAEAAVDVSLLFSSEVIV